MTDKERALEAVERLKKEYPDSDCALDYIRPWQLLFSARLAAQCTDKMVNIVSKELYKRFPTLKDMAEADVREIEEIIRPTGFFRIKARDLKACAQILIEKYGGEVPDSMDELLELPGIGRKIANLILGDVFGMPAVVADTHCIRLSNRIGLCDSVNPYKVEMRLKELVPPEEQNGFCHRLVDHGRAVCNARSPKCTKCVLEDICEKNGI